MMEIGKRLSQAKSCCGCTDWPKVETEAEGRQFENEDYNAIDGWLDQVTGNYMTILQYYNITILKMISILKGN